MLDCGNGARILFPNFICPSNSLWHNLSRAVEDAVRNGKIIEDPFDRNCGEISEKMYMEWGTEFLII